MTENERKKKLALVTGGAGFVGSHLCRELIRRGYEVISLDNYLSGSRNNQVDGVRYREGHTKHIERLIPETPDIIYHLGEYARVEKSFEDLEKVFDANVEGTFAVLEYWRKRGCKLLYAGSSTKFAEEGRGKNLSPYTWTKASNTELVKNYGEWFSLPYVITYFYSVYGPGERSDQYGTVIEIFRQQYLRGLPLTLVAPGTQERNFTHIYDTIDGLVRAGEEGHGDEYGIGASDSYSLKEVAEMFESEIVMLPPRKGNRTSSPVDTKNVTALGWTQKYFLKDYIRESVVNAQRAALREKRILVFTTTFHPIAGPAEHALCDLMLSMPDIHFDVVTTLYHETAKDALCPVPNATVYRMGYGNRFDKWLLPFLGAKKGRELIKKHSYLFGWALLLGYASLAANRVRAHTSLPLLLTLADQSLTRVPWYSRLVLKFILRHSDAVYATSSEQEKAALSIAERASLGQSLGEGDPFANAVRFAYSQFVRKYIDSEKEIREHKKGARSF